MLGYKGVLLKLQVPDDMKKKVDVGVNFYRGSKEHFCCVGKVWSRKDCEATERVKMLFKKATVYTE